MIVAIVSLHTLILIWLGVLTFRWLARKAEDRAFRRSMQRVAEQFEADQAARLRGSEIYVTPSYGGVPAGSPTIANFLRETMPRAAIIIWLLVLSVFVAGWVLLAVYY